MKLTQMLLLLLELLLLLLLLLLLFLPLFLQWFKQLQQQKQQQQELQQQQERLRSFHFDFILISFLFLGHGQTQGRRGDGTIGLVYWNIEEGITVIRQTRCKLSWKTTYHNFHYDSIIKMTLKDRN